MKAQRFYRPLGGGVDFGERGAEAIARELREELGIDVRGACYLGTLENIFVLEWKQGHEVVLMYEVELDALPATPFRILDPPHDVVTWMPLSAFSDGSVPLYPDGLYELLSAASPAR